MAASPAFPGVKSLGAPTASADVRPVQDAPVVRAEVHTMSVGAGTRSLRRRITPQAGFALEILGHAIEYLADEYAHEAGRVPRADSGCVDPQVVAMQILMSANRQVYFECPVATPFYTRIFRRFFAR